MDGRKKILVAGAGGIGRAVGLLLREVGHLRVEVLIGDAREEAAREAAEWIRAGSSDEARVSPFRLPPEGMSEPFGAALEQADILLDCLPGSQAPRMAELALGHHLHYANLTEHVAETERIRTLAAGAETGFVLQTGLAPGFIDVLGHGLFQRFCRRFGVERVDAVGLRTGALSDHAVPPHYYAFTWSPIGVATEYVEPTRAMRDGEPVELPALGEVSKVRLEGVVYEESPTSGGVADLPEALAGRVGQLDYKTLRYPGHYEWVRGLIADLPRDGDRPRELLARMREVVARVDDDLVVLYAFVQGRVDGELRRSEVFRRIEPIQVGARRLLAIQATTAAALAECARMLLAGRFRGVVLQSRIDPEEFLAGPFVDLVYRSAGVMQWWSGG